MTGKNVPYNQFDSSANVAIIGAGASGSMAAWMFEQSGVSYTVFEKEDYIGGHAFTPHITKINEEDVDVDVDMGYIFGGGYRQMTDLLKAYDVKTLNHSLTYSSHRGDKFFSNNVIPGPEDSLHDEWMRFQKEITGWNNSPRGMNLYRLLPFTIWYRFQGYSDEFFESVLAPGLSLLFISKTSLWHQPAFMVLGMFNNYIFLDPVQRKKESMIWVVERGSQRMYDAFTAGLNIKLSHAVQSIQRELNGKLTVVTDKGDFEGFTNVIITVGDGMTKLWNPENNRFRWIINQIKFVGCDSYLHSDQSIIPSEVDTDFYLNWNADGGMAYWKDLEFSGKMTKIFEYDTDQDVILTLSPNREIPKEKIYHQKRWYHPTQDFWHLALVLMVLPKFNGMEQVYFAGDWSVDIGHNSAFISGIKAACWVGVKEDSDGPMKDLYKTYYTDNCLAEDEVPDDINEKSSGRRA